MSEKPAFEDDDIYDFDFLKEDSQELSRPKLKQREVHDNRIKLPPVLIGRNLAAIDEAKKAKRAKRSNTKSAVASNSPEIDWHKERQKLRAPRQPLKEEGARTLGFNESWRKTKLPKIKGLFTEPTLGQTKRTGRPDTKQQTYQQTTDLNSLGKENEEIKALSFSDQIQEVLEMTQDAVAAVERGCSAKESGDKEGVNDLFAETDIRAQTSDSHHIYLNKMAMQPKPPTDKPLRDSVSYSKTRRRLLFNNEKGGLNEQKIEKNIHKNESIQQPLVSATSLNTSSPIKEITHSERRLRVRFAGNTELNQDVSVHNESKPFYRPRPKTPYEIDYDEEIKQATALSKGFDELHKELQNKDLVMDDCVDLIDDILSIPPSGPRPTKVAVLDTADDGVAPYDAFHAETQLRPAPELTWNGENARRGAGFVSKLKKQNESKSTTGVNTQLPEKIRKQMKKYFN